MALAGVDLGALLAITLHQTQGRAPLAPRRVIRPHADLPSLSPRQTLRAAAGLERSDSVLPRLAAVHGSPRACDRAGRPRPRRGARSRVGSMYVPCSSAASWLRLLPPLRSINQQNPGAPLLESSPHPKDPFAAPGVPASAAPPPGGVRSLARSLFRRVRARKRHLLEDVLLGPGWVLIFRGPFWGRSSGGSVPRSSPSEVRGLSRPRFATGFSSSI